MAIPHYQQVGRNPDGTRREWRAGEAPMYAKGHPLNPRRLVKIYLPKQSYPIQMSIADCRAYLGWTDEQLKTLKGWS